MPNYNRAIKCIYARVKANLDSWRDLHSRYKSVRTKRKEKKKNKAAEEKRGEKTEAANAKRDYAGLATFSQMLWVSEDRKYLGPAWTAGGAHFLHCVWPIACVLTGSLILEIGIEISVFGRANGQACAVP